MKITLETYMTVDIFAVETEFLVRVVGEHVPGYKGTYDPPDPGQEESADVVSITVAVPKDTWVMINGKRVRPTKDVDLPLWLVSEAAMESLIALLVSEHNDLRDFHLSAKADAKRDELLAA